MGRVNLDNALNKFENLNGAFSDETEVVKPVKEVKTAKTIAEPKIKKIKKVTSTTSSGSSTSSEKKKYGIEADDTKQKVTLFLDKEVVIKLQLDIIKNGKSKSLIVEELLAEYF